MTYLVLKTVHIVSATILFGTGLGTAYSLFRAWRAGSAGALRVVTRSVVQADWCFTLPAVVIQPLTGAWLMRTLGYPLASPWFAWVAGLYLLAGACWLPVVWIQLRLRRLATAEPPGWRRDFDHLMRIWTSLGVIAFSAVLALFGLMVFKPGLA